MDRPAWVTNEAEWLSDCKAIVHSACDLMEGRRGIIESARVMQRLARKVRDERDANFIVFGGIASESDDLPVGEERRNWAASALEREDAKIKIVAFEEQCREAALRSAKHLVDKYSPSGRLRVSTSGSPLFPK